MLETVWGPIKINSKIPCGINKTWGFGNDSQKRKPNRYRSDFINVKSVPTRLSRVEYVYRLARRGRERRKKSGETGKFVFEIRYNSEKLKNEQNCYKPANQMNIS